MRRDAELIRAGVLGDVQEIHLWTDRPCKWWKQGVPTPIEFPPVPESMNWDLWTGGSVSRPYHPAYSHFLWRGWWDYGTGPIGDNGQIMIGSKDTFYSAGYNGGGMFKSGAQYDAFKDSVPETIPKTTPEKWESSHYDEWIAACKGGPKSYSNFDVSGPVTEVVLLGTLALLAPQLLEWDAKELAVSNIKEANRFVTKTYRKGWEA